MDLSHLSQRDQDTVNVILAFIKDDIHASPESTYFRKATKEPIKMPGGGKINVPMAVWEAVKDAPALKHWNITIEPGAGTSPEFIMNKRK